MRFFLDARCGFRSINFGFTSFKVMVVFSLIQLHRNIVSRSNTWARLFIKRNEKKLIYHDKTLNWMYIAFRTNKLWLQWITNILRILKISQNYNQIEYLIQNAEDTGNWNFNLIFISIHKNRPIIFAKLKRNVFIVLTCALSRYVLFKWGSSWFCVCLW